MTRPLPSANEAEAAMLGAVLLTSGQALDAVAGIASPDDCYVPAHQELFRASLDLAAAGQPVDLVTLEARLQDTGKLKRVGGVSAIAELATCATTAENIEHHARIVRDRAQLRRLIRVCQEAVAKAHEPEGSADELVASVQRDLEDCYSQEVGGRDIREVVKDWMARAQERFQARQENREHELVPIGVPTGLVPLDAMLTGGGLPCGQLTFLGADTSRGKSALAANIVWNVARHGAPVLWCSLEDSDISAVTRVLARLTGVPNRQLQSQTVEADEWSGVTEAAGEVARVRVRFITRTPRTVEELCSQARRWAIRNNARLLVMDYFQLIRLGRPAWSKQDVADQKLEAIVHMAKDLPGCATLVVTQYRRRDEKEPPRNQDLYHSGALEQEAYTILHLWDPPVEMTHNCKAVLIGKQKQGPPARIVLGWSGDLQRFADPDPDEARGYNQCLNALTFGGHNGRRR